MPKRLVTFLVPLLILATARANAFDPDLLTGMAAREIGPAAVSGRVTDIGAEVGDPNRILVGTATGGAWQSDNGGLTWTAVFDDEAVASIGAVAIFQPNPSIRWIGTGEGNVRNSTSIGAGIWKSVDGGENWERVGLEKTERIHRIAVHPANPDVVYVAALGELWGGNSERGIYRTSDGGQTWEKVLYVDEKTGGTEVHVDPFNPDKIYAALWQFRRWPSFFRSGGAGSGLYISHDGGETWEQRTEEDGLPKGELGRIGISPSAAQRDRVYALVEAKKSAFMRSDDGGRTWQQTNTEPNVATRPFYYTEIQADPADANRVYNIYTRLGVSIDGGKTFERNAVVDCCRPANTIHIDNHALWVNPADANHVILGNDGGIAITRDRGETWRFVRNLPLAQFYHVAVDDAVPYNVYGGLQDNGSWRGPSEIWQVGGIRNLHWQEVGFGDGFDTVPDPDNPRAGYAMSQGGNLTRWNLDSGEQRLIKPNPPEPGVDLRFNWSAGLAIDPFDPDVVYYGSQFLHRSGDRGRTWTVISPDLTSNDPERQKFRETGGITPDVTAAENNTTIVAVAPSTLERGVIWVGTDDGRVHVTRDGGENWSRVDTRARGFEPGAWVPMIEPSRHDPAEAFVVVDDHRRSDMAPYVYRLENYGQRWRSLVTENLSGYALSIRQDFEDPNLLFLGTEFGLWFSTNGGEDWTKFTAGVPTVSVMDLALQQRETDLVLGTHGRGIFVIDDYRALRGLEPDDMEQRLALRGVTDGQQYRPLATTSTRFTGSGEFRGENEPYGATVTFIASGNDLTHPDADRERERKTARREAQESEAGEGDDEESKDKKKESKPRKIELTVFDTDGEAIRTRKLPVHQGINRITWNLRRDGVRPPPAPNRRPMDDGLPAGPEVPPGDYPFRLTLGGEGEDVEETVIEGAFRVVPDPRVPHDAGAQQAAFELRVEILGLREQAVEALETIDTARSDTKTVLALLERSKDDATAEDEDGDDLAKQGKALVKALDELEQRFRVPPGTRGNVYDDDRVFNRIGLADRMVSSSFDAPSEAARGWLTEAEQTLASAKASLDELLEGDVAAYRAAVEAAGIGLLTP
ncbi:MAG: hypothetical protein AAGE01_02540 [Pseudomonadota bacterium]